jgi:cbb3-type cytochrome oxidase subunit 3
MDTINDIRSGVTLLGFFSFLWLVRWAWSAARRGAFDAAAQLPFTGDEDEKGNGDE